MSAIRIAIVDDQTIIREGLAALLALISDLEVVGTAGDGQTGVELVAERKPDVVLMDVRMPGMNGIAAAREIRARCPRTRVIMLTTFDNDEHVFAAVRVGASGYLLKNADPEYLAAAIRTVYAGDAILDPKASSFFIRFRESSTGCSLPVGLGHAQFAFRRVVHENSRFFREPDGCGDVSHPAAGEVREQGKRSR